jgi:hypothetical protein
MSDAIFFRLLSEDDKASGLSEAVRKLREGQPSKPIVCVVDPESFRQVPGSPFAYWVSERIRRLFTDLPPFEGERRTVKQGLATADDFRFVRAWWEVSPETIVSGSSETTPDEFRRQTFEGKRWVPFAKGGAYSPYYADLHLVVNWELNGEQLRNFERAFIRNEDFYFRPGLTWPRRTTSGISFRTMNGGVIFGDKGPAAFVSSLLPTLALVQSLPFESLIGLQLAAADAAARSYEVGVIQSGLFPDLPDSKGTQLTEIARSAIKLKRTLLTADESNHIFWLPALSQVAGSNTAERVAAWIRRLEQAEQELAACQRKINDVAFMLYGIDDEDRRAIEEGPGAERASINNESESDDSDDANEPAERSITDQRALIADLLAYAIGCAFGRWDVRFATGERTPPALPDPFDPLPVCSPGMLQGDDGLPLKEAPLGYPLKIDWDGILVDDSNHPDDIIRRVREVLELIWTNRAEAIEKEACEVLSVRDLREYFRKTGTDGFWPYHVKRYSKSRRKAPIYWLLQSSKKNYALSVYYHRLDKDILFKALQNYVEPKIRLEESRVESLRSQKAASGEAGKGSKKIDKDIERQEEILSELRDFKDKLQRAANLHLEPDLNDGVVLNIAPLWELVPWKEPKKYWQELLEGKYEWSAIGKQLRAKGIVTAPAPMR